MHPFLLLLFLPSLHHGLEFLGEILGTSQFVGKVDVGDLAFPEGGLFHLIGLFMMPKLF